MEDTSRLFKRVFVFGLALLVLSAWTVPGALAQIVQQPPLNPNKIPQFVDPLPLLTVQGGPMETVDKRLSTTQQDIYMHEFAANVLPATTKLPNKVQYAGTWVWGYRTSPTAPTVPVGTYIGPVFVTKRNQATQIKWVNSLLTAQPAAPNVPFWWASTDQTLHWADPLGDGMQMTNYAGPVPAVVHLHGGEVPPQLDGGPDAWYTSNGLARGHSFYTKDGAASNYAIYNYPNTQEAANIWFHDHVLGITRLNVYAGMAGAYIITDDGTNAPSPTVLNDPTKIVPIVIQDRMFDINGQLYFPNVGINPEHPFWVPEFVGDTIVVNGKSWPFLNVGLDKYRFLFLNGSNARAYELDLFDRTTGMPGPPMWVIGTDGGYLDNPVMIDPLAKQKLIIMPGERYDVIIDFSVATGGYAGQVLELRNTARTPYPFGAPVQGKTTARVMQFRVLAATPANPPTIAYTPQTGDTLRADPIETLGAADKTRQLTLNEVMGPGGPLEVLVNNTKWSGIDRVGFTPVTNSDGTTTYYTELPEEGQTEDWQIINMTADAHPIHLHLVQFQLVSRQPFDVKGYTAAYDAAFPGGVSPVDGLTYPANVFIPGFGPPGTYTSPNLDGAVGGNPALQSGAVNYLLGVAAPPLPQEAGWKDTVIMYPGEVTTIKVRWAPQDATAAVANYFPFDPNGGHGYVWHCHIIDHEDNEMMRPTQVQPDPVATRTYVQGADY